MQHQETASALPLFGDWAGEDIAAIIRDFDAPSEALEGAVIIAAEYTYEDYSGSAAVIYQAADGLLYEVHGGHCSCYGLEGQWEPEEVPREALAHRFSRANPGDTDAFRAAVRDWLA
ncbi:hypothetical protein [Shinella zoogloeoides]|uniref:hypothetical protein n=1 Tax=Shinella zoogloeoides TaxID=352475 RepID=UPI00273F0770|nr:hypothetical protein [Shinella zoogloeoides]WLR94081.1 hypothetical protein Q9316_07840 [Shinella zoogloeoides]